MSNARDYVGNSPRKKKTAKRNTSANQIGEKGNYIKFIVVLVLVVGILGVMFVMHSKSKDKTNTNVTENTQKQTIVETKKPTEKYSYRQLLENSEVKTTAPGNKEHNRNNSTNSGNNNQRKLIIEKNPNLKEIRAENESRAEEAKRAQDILNGSLNTPKSDQVRTVKIDHNGQATIFQDGRSNKQQNVNVGKQDTPVTKPQSEPRDAKKDSEINSDQSKLIQVRTQEQKTKPQNVENKSQQTTPNKNQKVEKLVPVFVMQCGSFKTKEQAEVLKNKVVSKGQRGYIEKAIIKSEIWYRVMVGPFATKNLASDVYTKLKSAKIVSACNIIQNK